MIENRKEQDDLFVGMLFTTLHPENGRITWCLKEYDPDDKENFPLPLQFKQAGEFFAPQNPGRVLEVQNDDGLVVFIDRAYTRPLLRGMVSLDYETGKVPDPTNQHEKVQMIGKSPVNGIPTNIPPEQWCEIFYEGRPAVLFRRKSITPDFG